MNLQINTLNKHMTSEPNEFERVDYLNNLAEEVLENKPEKALELAGKSGGIATRLGYHNGVAYSLFLQAKIYNNNSEFDKAIESAESSLILYDKIGDISRRIDVLELMGDIKKNAGSYNSALEFYEQSLSLVRENTNNEKRLANLLKKSGNILLKLGDFNRALEFYRQCLSIAQRADDIRTVSIVLNNIGTIYRFSGNHEAALEHFEKSLEIKKELNDEIGRANTLNNIGIIYEDTGKYPQALEYYQKSLPIIRKLNDRAREIGVLSNIGVVYRQIGHFPKALEFFLESLKICNAINQPIKEAEVLNNIGMLYLESDETATALSYLERSLEIWNDIGDKRSAAITLDSIGGSHYKAKKYELALEKLKKSLEISRSFGDEYTVANTLSDIAHVYSAQGKTTIALDYFRKSYDTAEKIEYKHRQSEALLGIGEIHISLRDYSTAQDYLRHALRIAEELGSRDLLYKIHYSLSIASENLNMLQQAINHLRAHQRFKEEVFNEESDKTFKKLQAVHEVETAKQESELYRLKNIKLAKLNQQLTDAISEKNEILGIAAHDLKNPLSVLLLTAQHIESSYSNMSSEQVTRFMNNISTTADNMLEIVNKMLQSEEYENKLILYPEIIDITAIINEVIEHYQVKADKKNITIRFPNKNEIVYVFSDAVATKQILENLMSNAIKFSNKQTTVTASFVQTNTTVRVSIKDEGPGLSEDDKKMLFKRFSKLSAKPTGDEHSTGLGLSIVKKLTEKLFGQVWCESQLGKGANFIVELPRFPNQQISEA